MPSDYLSERQEVLEAVRRIVELGLVAHASGNVSRRIPTSEGELFAITVSRVPYHRFGIDDVLVVDPNIDPVVGDGIPSSESLAHLAVYAARPDTGAVIHTLGPRERLLSPGRPSRVCR
jgi:L-fuculose-phosphate aldolase